MGRNEHDVVIVGGGHNGLACAAYLAQGRARRGGPGAPRRPGRRRGHRGAVAGLPRLERLLRRVADAAADRERARAETPRVRGLDHQPDYFVPFPDGTSLTLWGDMARDRENIGRLSAHDAEAWVAFDAYFERVAKLLKDLLFVVPPNMRLAEAAAVGEDGRPLPRLDRARHPRVGAAVHDERGRLPGRVVRRRTREGGARDAGDHRRLVRTDDARLGLRPDAPLDRRGRRALRRLGMGEGRHGRRLARHGQRRARQPAPRFAPTLRCRGSRSTAMGRAVGVELDDGSLVRARAVVSNAHPTTTYLDLVGEEQLPADVVRDIRRYRTRSGSVKINIGLSALPDVLRVGSGGRCASWSHRDVAVDGVPGTRVRRCEVRQGVGASVRGGDVPDRARAAARSRRASTS